MATCAICSTLVLEVRVKTAHHVKTQPNPITIVFARLVSLERTARGITRVPPRLVKITVSVQMSQTSSIHAAAQRGTTVMTVRTTTHAIMTRACMTECVTAWTDSTSVSVCSVATVATANTSTSVSYWSRAGRTRAPAETPQTGPATSASARQVRGQGRPN